MSAQIISPLPSTISKDVSTVIAGLGAVGVAVQNYQAVELFLLNIFKTGGCAHGGLLIATQAMAVITGGVCSGMVNYWMNVELLNDFSERLDSKTESAVKKLNTWQKIQYFAGLAIFVVTGLLFGLMAFTFAETGPLATFSICVGLFVSAIMTIQEVETWLSSYSSVIEKKESLAFSQWVGKSVGHLIALGNVLALSLLFTLSVSQSLIFFGVVAAPAIIIGAAIAFTFGAFTEFYFYNFYLAEFCKNLSENIKNIANSNNLLLGALCVTTNAFVNAALTYSGIELLTALIISSSLITPPAAVVMTITVLSTIFAGSASFILGADFWCKQNTTNESQPETSMTKKSAATFTNTGLGFFSLSTGTEVVIASPCVEGPERTLSAT